MALDENRVVVDLAAYRDKVGELESSGSFDEEVPEDAELVITMPDGSKIEMLQHQMRTLVENHRLRSALMRSMRRHIKKVDGRWPSVTYRQNPVKDLNDLRGNCVYIDKARYVGEGEVRLMVPLRRYLGRGEWNKGDVMVAVEVWEHGRTEPTNQRWQFAHIVHAYCKVSEVESVRGVRNQFYADLIESVAMRSSGV